MSLLSRAKKILKPHSAKATRGEGEKGLEKQHSHTTEGTADTPKLSALAARIGLMPLLTEKSFEAQAATASGGAPSKAGAGGSAAFRVKMSASKQEIARAVREQYGTKVLAVRTTRMRGKVRRRGMTYGATPRWKKAYVKVEDIQKLQVTP